MKILVRMVFLLLALRASAQELEKEVWRAGDTVEVRGHAREDVFVSGAEVVLSGEFDGDVWAMGRGVRLTGQAREDVRMGALEVLQVDAEVEGVLRAAAFGGNVVVGSQAVVAREALLLAGRTATVGGRFGGDLFVQAAKISLDAEVMGDLTLVGMEVNLLPGTVVHGNVLYRAGQEVMVPEGVVVHGEVREAPGASGELERGLRRLRWTLLGLQFFSAFLVGLLLVRLLPRFMARSVEVVARHRGASSGMGILALFGVGFTGWLLLPTLLGTGLGLFLLLVIALLFYCGKIVAALALGALLLRCGKPCGMWRVSFGLLLGLALLYSAFQLPYIGFAVQLLASASGLGAMLLCIRHSQRLPPSSSPPLSLHEST